MTQFPHDEFDDVPPYKSDEVGKHRAPGAAAASGRAGGGLKWIGLLAALVLVIGGVAWAFSQFGGDNADEPTADPDDEQTVDAPEEDDSEAEDEEDAEENGEEAAEEDADVDMDFGIIVYNYDGTEGVAGAVREQLDGAGFNVVDQSNWVEGWNTCGESAPVVVHPPAEEDLAGLIADEIGAATCSSEGWTDSGVIAVAVGADSLP